MLCHDAPTGPSAVILAHNITWFLMLKGMAAIVFYPHYHDRCSITGFKLVGTSFNASGLLYQFQGAVSCARRPSLGSVGKTGSGIHPELVDLTCMLSPGSSASPEGQRDEVG